MAGAAPQFVTEDHAKALGAYYTDSPVAHFLVTWAVRRSTDTVLDPSFGGGVFLYAASRRLRDLGGDPAAQIFGVELSASAHRQVGARLASDLSIAAPHLLHSDFFEILPERLPLVDAVVGNPPFIRYQRFTGEVRQRALRRAAEQGLKLSALSSSWLPFLVHSIRFLREGGRLAMVIPFEIGHAAYARPVLDYLARSFHSVEFLTFRKKLFPDLSEDTILLLADGRSSGTLTARFQLRDLLHAAELPSILDEKSALHSTVQTLDARRISDGTHRLIENLIPAKARSLYRRLRADDATIPLGDLADVGIGYVTGANDFFHLSAEQARCWRIPQRYLRPAVRRGRALQGLRFTPEDWRRLLSGSDAGHLLALPASGGLPESVQAYLAEGLRNEVHRAFKCRNRTPWYHVPHVYLPDCFLTYMSGHVPRLVANEARAVAPNTLHVLRLRPDTLRSGAALAALWQTSLTQLSVEIEGHALGGGMLKLEPTEAERVLLPRIQSESGLEDLALYLDGLVRHQGHEAALEYADQELLEKRLGLSLRDIQSLREAAASLRARRTGRGVNDERSRRPAA